MAKAAKKTTRKKTVKKSARKSAKRSVRKTNARKNNKKIKSIGIIGKEKGREVSSIARQLADWLLEKKYEVHIDSVLYKKIKVGESHAKSDVPRHSDLLIVLGGDGTLLSAARLIGDRSIPILGVNVGTVGFLTNVQQDELFDVLPGILKGNFEKEHRDMLSASIFRRGEQIADYNAFNDVVIHRGALARIIDLEVKIDGEFMTLFRADGLVLATSTGSTAYSLAAGGPIVHPTLKTILVTPISSFSMNQRPVVISNECDIEIKLKSESGEVYVSLDGQVGFSLTKGDVARVCKAKQTIDLIKSPTHSYYEVLRSKLNWGTPNA